jgi:hypothetical protein
LRVVVILGAGASADYDPEHPELCPPTTTGLLTCPDAVALLQLPRYAALDRRWKAWRASASTTDVEEFADAMASRIDLLNSDRSPVLSMSSEWWQETGELGEATGGLWFLLFELFQTYQRRHRKGKDNYRRLIERFRDDDLVLVSLNYDALLESSIIASGGRYEYRVSGTPGVIPIVKPHGSFTWLNPASAGGGQMWDSSQDQQVKRVFQFVYSNIFETAPINVITPAQFAAMKFTDLIHAQTHYAIPAILPPIGRHKDPRQIRPVVGAWEAVGRLLGAAERVVFVGTSLREDDEGLLDAVTLGLARPRQVEVVGNYGKLKPILDHHLGWTRRSELPNMRRFSDWAAQC